MKIIVQHEPCEFIIFTGFYMLSDFNVDQIDLSSLILVHVAVLFFRENRGHEYFFRFNECYSFNEIKSLRLKNVSSSTYAICLSFEIIEHEQSENTSSKKVEIYAL